MPRSATKENDFLTFVFSMDLGFWACVTTTALSISLRLIHITHLGMCIFAHKSIHISAGCKGYGLSCWYEARSQRSSNQKCLGKCSKTWNSISWNTILLMMMIMNAPWIYFVPMIISISTQVGEGRVAKVADFGLTRDVYIDEAYWKRSSGKCNYF